MYFWLVCVIVMASKLYYTVCGAKTGLCSNYIYYEILFYCGQLVWFHTVAVAAAVVAVVATVVAAVVINCIHILNKLTRFRLQ